MLLQLVRTHEQVTQTHTAGTTTGADERFVPKVGITDTFDYL
jgi:hypothetical protein